MKSFFDSNLLAILAKPIPKPILHPWILNNIDGERIRPDQIIILKIRSSSKTTVNINIQKRITNFDHVLAKNKTLYAGDNNVIVSISLSGANPSKFRVIRCSFEPAKLKVSNAPFC
ncbi:hypothetical protein Glove_151g150 [Diversispora epigaea]|uniref:Uncharacterized protein n=1 Tax=Diversispora epigaea TaxID=1348612 RepID=A0A397IWN5_9GLOM|nr:hypothetical protein Glove_151g150 [Diversispora epigaea]